MCSVPATSYAPLTGSTWRSWTGSTSSTARRIITGWNPPARTSMLRVVGDQTVAPRQLACVADGVVKTAPHDQGEVLEVASGFVEQGLGCPDAVLATFGEPLKQRVHVGLDSRAGRQVVVLRGVGPRFELLGGRVVTGRPLAHPDRDVVAHALSIAVSRASVDRSG